MHLRNVSVSGSRLLAVLGTVTLAASVIACGGGNSSGTSSTSSEPFVALSHTGRIEG